MPEGPSIVILKEQCAIFKGKKVVRVEGNSKAGIEQIQNQKIVDFKSYGKNFLICFKSFTVRIHLMLFGSYRINERKEIPPRLSLQFDTGELNFYTCVVEIMDRMPNALYDWELDVMNPQWNETKVISILKENPKALACDVLLNQRIFAGVGNIIKNEVLYRIKVHPESVIQTMPVSKIKQMVREARVYSFDFYTWKKAFELKKHWLVHRQKICVRCNLPITMQVMGKTNRRTFFCANCQLLYNHVGTEIVSNHTKNKHMANYGQKAQEKVEKAMHERKEGTLKSGRSGKKVTSKKQAIAIGLSEARKAGGKVPKKAATKKSAAKKSKAK